MSLAKHLLPTVRLVTRQQLQISRAGARRTFTARSNFLVKKYTKEHEWVELDDSGKIGTIGISAYAAELLGDVVYVELPEKNLEFNGGDVIGAVESTKSASDIYAPIGGKVIETNELLEKTPGTINKTPEGEGWLAKIEVKEASEIDALMSKEEYDAMEKDQ